MSDIQELHRLEKVIEHASRKFQELHNDIRQRQPISPQFTLPAKLMCELTVIDWKPITDISITSAAIKVDNANGNQYERIEETLPRELVTVPKATTRKLKRRMKPKSPIAQPSPAKVDGRLTYQNIANLLVQTHLDRMERRKIVAHRSRKVKSVDATKTFDFLEEALREMSNDEDERCSLVNTNSGLDEMEDIVIDRYSVGSDQVDVESVEMFPPELRDAENALSQRRLHNAKHLFLAALYEFPDYAMYIRSRLDVVRTLQRKDRTRDSFSRTMRRGIDREYASTPDIHESDQIQQAEVV